MSIYSAFGQDDVSKKFVVGAKYHKGFILQHRDNYEPLIRDHISGLSLKFEFQTNGANDWEALYQYPQIGVGFDYYNLGNLQELGEAYHIYPYLNMYLKKRSKFAWKVQMGGGISYLTKRWDKRDNFKNKLISSALNASAVFGTDLEVKVAPHLNWSVGIKFTHFSNGAYRYPNLGVNLLDVNTGLSYRLVDHVQSERRNAFVDTSDWSMEALLTVFRKGESPGIKKLYAVWNGRLTFNRRANEKLFFQGGIDLFYDTWMEYYYLTEHIDYKAGRDYISSGLFVGTGLSFGRFRGIFSVGAYTYGKELPNGTIYNRLIAQYNFSQKWFGNFSIKAHYFKADYFELGVGYRLWEK